MQNVSHNWICGLFGQKFVFLTDFRDLVTFLLFFFLLKVKFLKRYFFDFWKQGTCWSSAPKSTVLATDSSSCNSLLYFWSTTSNTPPLQFPTQPHIPKTHAYENLIERWPEIHTFSDLISEKTLKNPIEC